jgi:hypothetical protein
MMCLALRRGLGGAGGHGGAVAGLARYRHRMPFNARDEGSKYVSMTWRAISGRP